MSRLLIRALRRELTALVAVVAAMSLSVGFASGSTSGYESSAAPAQADGSSAGRPPCDAPGRAGSHNPRCADGEEPGEEEPGEEEPGGEEPVGEEPGEEGSCATGGAADGGATAGEQLGGPGLDEDGPISGPVHEQAEPEAGAAAPLFHELACGTAALERQVSGGDEPGEEDPGGDEPGEEDPVGEEPGEEDPGEDGAGGAEPGEEDPVEDGCATGPDDDPVLGAVHELACAVTPVEIRVPAGVTVR
jgi:hypothetical protein